MHQPFTGPIFTVDGLAFHWDDVVLHAQGTGSWGALRDEVRLGLAACAELDASPDAEAETFVEQQADEFRYERDLLTAAEMEAWIEQRGLTVRGWYDCVRGISLRNLWHDRAAELLGRHAPEEAAVDAGLDAELACTDLPRTLAEALAADAAAAAASRAWATPPADRRLLVEDIIANARRFREAARTPDAIAREIQSRRMEWVRVECLMANFADPAQASEAVLCAREDRLPLDQVARDARVEAEEISFILDDLEPDLRGRFVSTRVGEVIGPVEREEGHLVFQVTARATPEPTDEELAARAADVIEERVVGVEIERRVRWTASRADAA
jgi:hypothetical protein